jgi:hypothetical protein
VLLNDNFIRHQAQLAARAALEAKPGNTADAIRLLFRQILGRDATTVELERVHAFCKAGETSTPTVTTEQALTDVCQTLFMTNEFLYVE